MWSVLLVVLSSAFLTIVQISFLSQLFPPFSELHFALIVMSYAIVKEKPVLGALWVLVSAVILDLHGLFGFGTQIGLLLVVFMLTREAYIRVFTNVSLLAVFLLTVFAVVAHLIGMILIDGIRILFGGIPYMVTFESSTLVYWVRSAIVNGIAVLLLIITVSFTKKRFANIFILHEKR